VLRLLADENFNGIVVSELFKQMPDLDLVRAQDVGLERADDRRLLEWAAAEDRVLLTHDLRTMPGFVYERVNRGLPVSGVIELVTPYSIPQAVEDILTVVICYSPDDMKDRIEYLPL
jgi:Domain of unknown function (DUF5615)